MPQQENDFYKEVNVCCHRCQEHCQHVKVKRKGKLPTKTFAICPNCIGGRSKEFPDIFGGNNANKSRKETD
jgi:hypothetical protein